jgi:hypothetical protein
MKITPITGNPLFNYKAKIGHADVAALGGGTTGTIALYPESGNGPAGMYVSRCALNLLTAFDASDAAINSLLIEVGDGGSTARLLAQTEIAADGTEILDKEGTAASAGYAYVAADTIDAKFTVAGGANPTLAEINAGEVEIYLQVIDLNQFEAAGHDL